MFLLALALDKAPTSVACDPEGTWGLGLNWTRPRRDWLLLSWALTLPKWPFRSRLSPGPCLPISGNFIYRKTVSLLCVPPNATPPGGRRFIEVLTLLVCQMTPNTREAQAKDLAWDVCEGLCVLGVVWRCIIRLCGHKYLSLCFQTPRWKEHVTRLFLHVCVHVPMWSAFFW